MTRAHPFHHMEAGEAAYREHQARQANGRLSTTQIVAEISAYAANEKKRRQRKNAPPEVGPTPERMAKVGAHEEILVPIKDEQTRATSRVYRVQTLFDSFSTKLTEEDRAALARAAKDYLDAQMPSAKLISSYGDGGGSAPGPRAGGVPDRCREAFNRIAHLSSYVGPTMFDAFRVLVIEVAEQAANPGRGFSPWRDVATSKGVSYGVLLATAWCLKHYYTRERALTKPEGRTAQEINAARQIRQERLAKERL